MLPVKPKKNLGQHFLKDTEIAKHIADTLDEFPLLHDITPNKAELSSITHQSASQYC